MKQNSTGGVLWARSFYGSSHAVSNDVTVDSSTGSVFVAGFTSSPSLKLDVTKSLAYSGGGYGGFLVKLNSTGGKQADRPTMPVVDTHDTGGA
jgi:hypothetical protein